VPDRIVFLNQKIQLVELKTETGVISERQRVVFEQLKAQGFSVVVLRSKAEIDALLEHMSTKSAIER